MELPRPQVPKLLADAAGYEFVGWLSRLWSAVADTSNTVTLTVSAATTVKADHRVRAQSAIFFTATTANAAAEIGAGTMYVSSKGSKTFTITHANNAQADRTFDYAVLE